jgi:hypothetical protein
MSSDRVRSSVPWSKSCCAHRGSVCNHFWNLMHLVNFKRNVRLAFLGSRNSKFCLALTTILDGRENVVTLLFHGRRKSSRQAAGQVVTLRTGPATFSQIRRCDRFRWTWVGSRVKFDYPREVNSISTSSPLGNRKFRQHKKWLNRTAF